MILIKNYSKADLLLTIDRELNHVIGFKDSMKLFKEVLGGYNTLSTYIDRNAVLKGIQSKVKSKIGNNFDLLGAIEMGVNNVASVLPELRKQVSQSSTKTYDGETITFKERGILDTVSAINFFNRYTNMVLDILLTQGYDEKADVKSLLNKVDFAFFNDTAAYYGNLLTRFSEGYKVVLEAIEALSDEQVDDLSEGIIAEAEGKEAVSVRQGLAPHEMNPLFWIRLWKMRRDVSTIQVSQEQIELMAMKIARLNNKRSGTEDPALDRQIETYENEILKKRAKIEAIMGKYNG
ncbi:hypothetical protein ACP1_0167 [Aeromonas phage ACP1]